MTHLHFPILQRATKGLCDPRSRFWLRWAPRLLVLSLLLSVGWMVALIFLMDGRLDSLEDSAFAKSLEDSQLLAMAHCALAGSAIPMLLDVFLDFIKIKSRKEATDEVTLVHFRTRAMLLLCSLVLTTVYASFRQFGNDADMRRLALVYAISTYTSRNIAFTTIVLPIMTLGIVPNTFLLAACIPQYIGPVLKLVHLLCPNQTKLAQIGSSLIFVSFLMFMVGFFVWGRDLWRRYKESRRKFIKMETTEFICIVYCTIFVLWAIFLVFSGSTEWRYSTEDDLWPLVLAQIFCIVPMTIIPGRISSANAQSRLQLLSQKQAFVRFVSHEIRTPLSIVAAGLEFFIDRLAPGKTTSPSSSPAVVAETATPTGPSISPNELLELANELSEATDTAINILNDLLQYESMDAGMFKLEAARVEPADLFKAKSLGIIAKRHSLTLKVVPPPVGDGVFVLADVYRIDQVVRNLVTNACKFTPAGGTIAIEAEVSLTISAAAAHGTSSSSSSRSSGSNFLIHGAHHASTLTPLESSVASFADMRAIRCGLLRVKVSDSGIGIQEHNKDKLFRQFEQFDKNELQAGGGSGLGLWISHYIVDCHGGKLQFGSLGSGKGSVFFFDLPLYQQQQQQQQHITTTFPDSMLERASEGKLPAAQGSLGEPRGSDAEAKEYFGAAVDSYPRPHTTTLPLHMAPSAPIQVPAPNTDLRRIGSESFDDVAGSASHGTAPKKVSFLLVDDSKGNRKMLRRMLESETSILVGSIQEAEDGVDAVALVSEAGSAIDCIFMDSVMKHMHGPETVRHLRGKLGFTGKILGLTGNAMEDDVKHFQQAGLDLLLIKPLRKAHLIEALLAHGLMSAQPVTPEVPKESRAGVTGFQGGGMDGAAEGGEALNSIKNDNDNNRDAETDTVVLGALQQRTPTAIHLAAAQSGTQAVWNCPFG